MNQRPIAGPQLCRRSIGDGLRILVSGMGVIALIACSVTPSSSNIARNPTASATPLAVAPQASPVLPTASMAEVATTPPTARPALRPTQALSSKPAQAPTATPAQAPATTPLPTASPGIDPVFVGAGDIADCDQEGAEQTAKLLDSIPGTVFTLGDNAYEDGGTAEFRECYDPTWGRHKARTRPTPGNHDYHASNAAPYYAYFGDDAGPAGRGYYSYNLGAWHIVSLNSEIEADANSPQAAWLRADLAANPAACTLAYWHQPTFSSGSTHGNSAHMKAIWDILAAAGADLILAGHEHNYERFAPQTSSAKADSNGIREFVIGTGGASHYPFGTIQPNSEVRNNDTFGVLKLTLHPTSYDWAFIPVAGKTFMDSGTAPCGYAGSQ